MRMRKIFALLSILLLFVASIGHAETKTMSWSPVSTYTDGSTIGGTALPVTYDAWWSITNTFVTPHNLLSSGTATSVVFDVVTQGMVRGDTIYFGARARSALGEVSVDSPPFSWLVPSLTLASIAITGGPATVNENSTATYTATATWSDGSTTPATVTWSVSPTTYASISGVGVLTTLLVTSDQTVVITASMTSGIITETATKTVTITNSVRPVAPIGLGIN